MSTESDRRKIALSPLNRLFLALVDILTGEVKAEVVQNTAPDGTHFAFRVKNNVQDR